MTPTGVSQPRAGSTAAGCWLVLCLLLGGTSPAAAGQWKALSAAGERYAIVAEDSPASARIFVERLTSAGAPYPGFGIRGRVAVAMQPGDEPPAGLAIDGAGRIILVGAGQTAAGATQPYVIRLQPSGQPDPAWGVAGRSSQAGQPGNARALDALPLPDGRMLIAGTAEVDGDERAAIWHLDARGQLDARPTRASRSYLKRSEASRAVSLTAVDARRVVVGVRVMADPDVLIEGYAFDVADPDALPGLLSRQPWPPAWSDSPRWVPDPKGPRWMDVSPANAAIAAAPAAAAAGATARWQPLAKDLPEVARSGEVVAGAAYSPFAALAPAGEARPAAVDTGFGLGFWAVAGTAAAALAFLAAWLIRRSARQPGAAGD